MIQTLFSSNDSHSTSLTDSLVEDWLTLLHAQPTKQTSKGKTWKFSKSHNMRWSQHFCQIFIRTHSIFRMRSWSPNNKGILSQFLVLVFPRPLEMEIKYRLFKQWQIKSYSLSKAWMWREKMAKLKFALHLTAIWWNKGYNPSLTGRNMWNGTVCFWTLQRIVISGAMRRRFQIFMGFFFFLWTRRQNITEIIKRKNERANENMNVRKTNARTYKCTNFRMHKRTNARTQERPHKRTSERTHVLTNESTYDRKNARTHKSMDAQTEKYY